MPKNIETIEDKVTTFERLHHNVKEQFIQQEDFLRYLQLSRLDHVISRKDNPKKFKKRLSRSIPGLVNLLLNISDKDNEDWKRTFRHEFTQNTYNFFQRLIYVDKAIELSSFFNDVTVKDRQTWQSSYKDCNSCLDTLLDTGKIDNQDLGELYSQFLSFFRSMPYKLKPNIHNLKPYKKDIIRRDLSESLSRLSKLHLAMRNFFIDDNKKHDQCRNFYQQIDPLLTHKDGSPKSQSTIGKFKEDLPNMISNLINYALAIDQKHYSRRFDRNIRYHSSYLYLKASYIDALQELASSHFGILKDKEPLWRFTYEKTQDIVHAKENFSITPYYEIKDCYRLYQKYLLKII